MLSLRIDPALKAAAERAAKTDRRTLTAYIETLIDADRLQPAPQRERAPKQVPTVILNLRIDAGLKAAAERGVAKSGQVTLTAYIETLIDKDLRKRPKGKAGGA